MKKKWRMLSGGVALAGAAMIGTTSGAVILPDVQEQSRQSHNQTEQHPDYAANHSFNLGNRDGYGDYKKKQHRKHRHTFADEKNRNAYEEGYQLGWQGRRSYRLDHRQSSWARVRNPHPDSQ